MIKSKQKQFDILMAEFNKEKQRVYVIETEKSIMVEAEKCMQKYCLQSFDAIHLASSEININSASHAKLPVSDIATLDSDFLNIDDNKFSFWCRGCSDLGISNYEKILPESERLKHDI